MSWIECSVILTSGAKQSGFTQITSLKEARAGIFVPILHVKRQKLEEAQQCGLEVAETRSEARTHVLWCVDRRMSPKLWWTMNHVQFFLTKNKSQIHYLIQDSLRQGLWVGALTSDILRSTDNLDVHQSWGPWTSWKDSQMVEASVSDCASCQYMRITWSPPTATLIQWLWEVCGFKSLSFFI